MEPILVAHKLVDKCEKKAKAVCKSYGAGSKYDKYSKGAQTMDRMIKINSTGFMGECAACIYLGLDPHMALDWQTKKPDGGADFIAPNGLTVDVKSSSHPRAHRLMWPVKKMDKLSDAADIFVLARVPEGMREDIGQMVELMGWKTKDYFIRYHSIAHGLKGIIDGTPFLNDLDLDDMELLKQHLKHI